MARTIDLAWRITLIGAGTLLGMVTFLSAQTADPAGLAVVIRDVGYGIVVASWALGLNTKGARALGYAALALVAVPQLAESHIVLMRFPLTPEEFYFLNGALWLSAFMLPVHFLPRWLPPMGRCMTRVMRTLPRAIRP